MKKSVNVLVLITFFTLQIFPPPNLLAAGEVVLEPVTGTHVPVKPYVPGTENEETPTPQAEIVPSLEDKPLSNPTPEVSESQNESRDLPEYSFDEATDYLTPDYAAAVIVRSVTAEDLKKLTQLEIEVGIAVIKGKLVLFTSGNREEIRLLPGAENLLKEASLIAHTHPPTEKSRPSYHDFAEAGEKIEYVVSAGGVYTYNHKGLANPEPYDFEYLAAEIQKLTNQEASDKEVRDLLNKFIQTVDEYNEKPEDAALFRAGHITELFPSASHTPANITPLPGNPDITRVTEQTNDPTQVVGTYRGLDLQYNTSQAAWAGGGFFFSSTQDLSGLSEILFGLKGDINQVKLEVVDRDNQKVSLHLKGIRSDIEQVWSIPTSALDGIDLTRVWDIYFIVEGAGQIGTLQINQAPPSTLTTADITPLPGNFDNAVVKPAGNTTGFFATLRGITINYDTNIGGWAGGGFTYDDFFTLPIETGDLSGFSQLVFGLKGDSNEVKFEIVDDQNNKASYKLRGIRSDIEQAYAIPASVLQGVDLTHVRLIYFIIEGFGKVGNLEVNRIPTTRFSRPVGGGTQRPLPRAERPTGAAPEPITEPEPSPVTLISAAWHHETILETHAAPSNSTYNFYLYEIDDSQNGVTRELRLKNEATGEMYSLGAVSSNETLHALDVDPRGKFALVNIKNPGIAEGGNFKIYDLVKKAFIQPVDPATGQTGDLLGVVDGSYQFVGDYVFFNYTDTTASFQLKKGIILNLAVDGVRMTRSIFIKKDQPIVTTPQGDKLLFTGTDNYSGYYTQWGIYDIATGILQTQQVGHRAGNDPIIAVSPDGAFAIVDHWENREIYAVGIGQLSLGTRIQPVQARLLSARFLTTRIFEANLSDADQVYFYVDQQSFRRLSASEASKTADGKKLIITSGNQVTVIDLATGAEIPRRTETILESHSAPSNANFKFYLYEINDIQNGITRELRLKNEITGEMFSVTILASDKEAAGLDVDPSGRYGLLNIQYVKDGYQTGELLVYDIQNHVLAQVQKINPTPAEDQNIYGRVGPREGNPSPYLFVDGLVLLNMYTYFTYQGQYSYFGYVLNLNTTPVRATKTFSIHRNHPALFTPQKDKFLFGTVQRDNHSITIYDMATGQIENRALATYGFGGIKAISSDGEFAIVGSSVNTLYAVPVRNANTPVRLLLLNCLPGTTCNVPTGLVLTSAEFLSNTIAKGTLANGETRYFLVTPQEFKLLGADNLTPVLDKVQNFYGDHYNQNAVLSNIEVVQNENTIEKIVVSVTLKNELAQGPAQTQQLTFKLRRGQFVIHRVIDFNASGQVLVKSDFDYKTKNGQSILEDITRRNALGGLLSTIKYVTFGSPYYEIKTRKGKRKQISNLAIRWFDLLKEAEYLENS